MLSKYRIFETDLFQKDLQRLSRGALPQVQSKLTNYIYEQLKGEPHFGPNIKKLRDWQPETWRYRVGDWRFFYEIDEEKKIIFMTAIHHRSEAY